MSEYSFKLRLAGRIIRVEALTPSLRCFCKEYLSEDGLLPESETDFTVSISPGDLEYERELSHRFVPDSENPRSDASLEASALQRKIAEGLLPFDTILLHASCLSIDGRGICFTAPSGEGKSTHAALWRDAFGARVRMVNDDKPFMRVMEQGVAAYGSPWNGVHHLGADIHVPLEAVCLLKRDEHNHIEAVSAEEAYPYLLGLIYRPRSADAMRMLLPLVDRFAHKLRLYFLGCTPDPEAAHMVYDKIFSAD